MKNAAALRPEYDRGDFHMNKEMLCEIRKWKRSDAGDLAAVISNKKTGQSAGRSALSLYGSRWSRLYSFHACFG